MMIPSFNINDKTELVYISSQYYNCTSIAIELEFIALSGYIVRDYTPNSPDEKRDLRYHLLMGTGEKTHGLAEAVSKAYEAAISNPRVFWHHGPFIPVTFDESLLRKKIEQGDTNQLERGSLLYALMFAAVPVWERPDLHKNWKGNTVTPFEYAQQMVFQFHDKRVESPVYIERVTGDEDVERLILE